MEKINVSVIGGNGVVGRAIVNSIDSDVANINIIDINSRKPKFESRKEIEQQDIIFICVPTPTNNGIHDSSIIEQYVDAFNLVYQNNKLSSDYQKVNNFKSLIVINSTTYVDYTKKYPDLRIVHNPEFLNEISSFEDFLNPGHIVMGGEINDCISLKNFYKNYTHVNKETEYFITTSQEAIDFKYMRNLKLAWDVTFWEMCHDLTQNSRKIQAMMKAKPLPTQFTVGLDGYRGFGGKCLPKDLKALIDCNQDNEFSKSALKVLKSVDEYNRKIV